MGFLRPTWGKIGISILLFYVYLFPLDGWYIDSGVSIIRLVYHLPLALLLQNALFVFAYFFILIVGYFLSCIAIAVYGKFRKKFGGVKRLPNFFTLTTAKVLLTIILSFLPFLLLGELANLFPNSNNIFEVILGNLFG